MNKIYTITCHNTKCNALFETSNNRNRYCCYACRCVGFRSKLQTGNYKDCIICGNQMYVANYQKTKKFCSRKCQHIGNSELVTKHKKILICCSNEFCMKKFDRSENHINTNNFCSIKCLNIFRSMKASETRVYKNTKPELYFESKLIANNIPYIKQFPLQWKRGWKKWYDFKIDGYNILIEIDGLYWHSKDISLENMNKQQLKTYNNDIIKNDLCNDRGYTLIRIWEDEIDLFNFDTLKTGGFVYA